MLKENLKDVEQNIKNACAKAGRERDSVTLVAVSKTKPVDMLKEIYDEGVRDFGENKVQEIVAKRENMNDDVRWHMIGHLQRNKVKYIIEDVTMIHSVDSYRLAEEINVQAKKVNRIVPILIEVNIAGEDTKFGVRADETLQLVEEIAPLENVKIEGLMTIAPMVDDPEDNRKWFKALRQMSVDIAEKNIDNVSMNELSMGMTGDYCVAIEEGATLVRVGTGIFGARNYSVN
ncbi:MAG: YggS family pyridoxal phosphate-dependent enzyme [Lachnospiraceae bacterium]|nr:YggS family pyridoxal phosphate-dependent enzyme [Lachnospiraceae bacterium]